MLLVLPCSHILSYTAVNYSTSFLSVSMATTLTPEQFCPRLREELKTIRTLEHDYRSARTSGDSARAKEVRATLTEALQKLQEKVNPFESRIQVREQYEAQCQLWDEVGILGTFATGEHAGKKGIRGIDGKEYPLPTYAVVSRRMVEKREALGTKIEQGFERCILVPFGMPLDKFIAAWKARLQKHFDDGALYHTRKKPDDPNEVPEQITKLFTDKGKTNPLYVWDEYNGADTNGKLVYYPKQFSDTHGGQTKQQVLDEKQDGWDILLLEDMPNIPRSPEESTTKGGRTQIDTQGTSIRAFMEKGQTVPNPHEYRKALGQGAYADEQGLTPEGEIACALTYLEETRKKHGRAEVIDDVDKHGRIAWLLGAYFQATGDVPIACWYDAGDQAYLGGDDPGDRRGGCGVRPAVGV